MTTRLTLALSVALLGGCFGMHGAGVDRDAGPEPPEDAGAPAADGGGALCMPLPASVERLTCPSVVIPGSRASVTLTTTPSMCCSSGTVTSSVSTTGRAHVIDLTWNACDCCEGCRCVGPIEEIEVDLGVVDGFGFHTVEVAGATCTFEVLAPPPPSECGPPVGATGFRAPTHLLEGQPYPVTLTSEPGGGCGCRPQIEGAETYAFSMLLCDCCDECDCIDLGYEASEVLAPPPLGEHFVGFPHGAGMLEVHERAECAEIPATAIRFEGPRDDLSRTGPRLWWAHVTGDAWVCCATPEPVVEPLDTTGIGSIALRLMTCHDIDCDCDPSGPTPTGQWVSLGELGAGTYHVRVGDLEETLVVP